jgi:hypothetical protein
VVQAKDGEFHLSLLQLAQSIVEVKYLPASLSLPYDLSQLVISGIACADAEKRLAWLHMLERLLHTSATETSFNRLQGSGGTMLVASILQSLFADSNTAAHYDALEELVVSLLQGDTQSILPVVIPSLFYAQTVAIQKSEVMGSVDELLHYLDSAAAITPSSTLFSKLTSAVAPPSPKSMYMMMMPLDTVESEGEEEEEEIKHGKQSPSAHTDGGSEIPLSPTELGSGIFSKRSVDELAPSSSMPSGPSPEVIPVDDVEVQKDNWMIRRPSAPLSSIFAMQLRLMEDVAKSIRSEDLKEYIYNV